MKHAPTTRSVASHNHAPTCDTEHPTDPCGRPTALTRRSILVGLASAPAVAAIAAPAAGSLVGQATANGDGIPRLARNREQRALSRFRYHNAEGFFLGLDPAVSMRPSDRLYRAGIVFQLALSSHLLDVGFDDEWCRGNIGLDVGKALRLANATGLGATDEQIDRLATAMSPYSKWRDPASTNPNADETTMAAIARMTSRRLLDHVREATGHPRRALRGRRSASSG
ncbi:MAG: hypothetical protein J0J06_11105 [Sphingomonas sp.]|uniref:hypothetical protein n=1 Tax=Sphingomonas sp. TaxID=28214 RepID=UPI001AD3971A|nr:hypothetical protein [Sphingomonas sp.]MBN8815984.1 hypothetical protein [Sphingomonas sp.]